MSDLEPDPDCRNCDGRGCMSCVSREMHDRCENDCPLCCVGAHDPVNHPSHYTSSEAKCSSCGTPIECLDVTRHMNFDRGSATKYIWRCGLKGDAVEDLKKAIVYLQDEIKRLGGEP